MLIAEISVKLGRKHFTKEKLHWLTNLKGQITQPHKFIKEKLNIFTNSLKKNWTSSQIH